MRKFVLLLLSTGMLFLTSCFDIVEEVYLNKDGSGTYTTKIDASGLFSNPFMKSALEEAAKEEGGEAVNMEQDSLMYYRDMEGFSDLSDGDTRTIPAQLGNRGGQDADHLAGHRDQPRCQ